METKVTLFELFVALAPVLALIIGGWIHMKVSVGMIKTELGFVQKELADEKEANMAANIEMKTKIDKIFSVLTEIKVSIAKNKD